MRRVHHRAFTLVEILIVVVILGILAGIVTPQLVGAATETRQTATLDQLQKIRRAVGVYQARNLFQLPPVEEGVGTWGPITNNQGEYLRSAPVNSWVGGENAQRIIFGTGPDTAYHTDYGWIYDESTGDVWAAGFDADDLPIIP